MTAESTFADCSSSASTLQPTNGCSYSTWPVACETRGRISLPCSGCSWSCTPTSGTPCSPAERTTGSRPCCGHVPPVAVRSSAGVPYVRPEGARTWAEAPPDGAEWAGALEPIPPRERRDFLLRSISWTSSLNVDWILADAATDPGPHAIAGAYDRYMTDQDRHRRGLAAPAGRGRPAVSRPVDCRRPALRQPPGGDANRRHREHGVAPVRRTGSGRASSIRRHARCGAPGAPAATEDRRAQEEAGRPPAAARGRVGGRPARTRQPAACPEGETFRGVRRARR